MPGRASIEKGGGGLERECLKMKGGNKKKRGGNK
jgi:hypothetical protein